MIDKKSQITNYTELYELVKYVSSQHEIIKSFSAGVYPDFNDTEHVYPSVFFETGQLYTSGKESRTYTIALHLFDKVSESYTVEDVINIQTKLDNIFHEIFQEIKTYYSIIKYGDEVDIMPTSEAENDLLVGIRAEFTITIGQTIKRGDKPFKNKLPIILSTTI